MNIEHYYNCNRREKIPGFTADHCTHQKSRWIWCVNALRNRECPLGFSGAP